jgi:hypothetical protein
MANTVARPPRMISFEQLCIEADSDFIVDLNQPEQYEFSNDRTFYHPLPFYVGPTINRGAEAFIFFNA